ncbi:MAG: hypothetical protein ABGX37_06635 [Methylococcales bacterium]|jgi:hypothetical protein|nr:hypothetical protein [Methylococcaceae bacterium]
MKCLYYLTSTLDDTRKITEDLHQAGIDDWFIHVLSRDEHGFKKYKIHASNYLEQLDLIRFGIIGAIAGFFFGLIAAYAVNVTELFGSNIPDIAYYSITGFFTLFGAWEGGLTGIATENKKIALFHDDLESGNYLILIYVKKVSEDLVRTVMGTQHQEAELAAIDASFYNPLVGLKRI